MRELPDQEPPRACFQEAVGHRSTRSMRVGTPHKWAWIKPVFCERNLRVRDGSAGEGIDQEPLRAYISGR